MNWRRLWDRHDIDIKFALGIAVLLGVGAWLIVESTRFSENYSARCHAAGGVVWQQDTLYQCVKGGTVPVLVPAGGE